VRVPSPGRLDGEALFERKAEGTYPEIGRMREIKQQIRRFIDAS